MPQDLDIPDKPYFELEEVAQIVGVKPFILRYWESELRDLFPPRDGQERRLYHRRELDLLLQLKSLLDDEKYTFAGAQQHIRQRLGGAPTRPDAPRVATLTVDPPQAPLSDDLDPPAAPPLSTHGAALEQAHALIRELRDALEATSARADGADQALTLERARLQEQARELAAARDRARVLETSLEQERARTRERDQALERARERSRKLQLQLDRTRANLAADVFVPTAPNAAASPATPTAAVDAAPSQSRSGPIDQLENLFESVALPGDSFQILFGEESMPPPRPATDHEARLEAMLSERSLLLDQRAQLQLQVDEVKANLQILEKSNQELRDELSRLRHKDRSQRASRAAPDPEGAALRKKLQHTERALDQARQQLSALQRQPPASAPPPSVVKERDALRHRLEATRDELTAARDALDALRVERDRLVDAHRALEDTHAQTSDALSRERDALRHRLAAFEDEERELSRSLDDLDDDDSRKALDRLLREKRTIQRKLDFQTNFQRRILREARGHLEALVQASDEF